MKESTALEPTVAERVQRVREGEESWMTSIFLAWGVRWLMVPFIEVEIRGEELVGVVSNLDILKY